MSFDALDARVGERSSAFVAELRDLVAVPSVSAEGRAIEPAAAFVLERLRRRCHVMARRLHIRPPTQRSCVSGATS